MERSQYSIFAICLTLLTAFNPGVYAESVKVNSVESFNKAKEKISPGDSILWKSGTFTDIDIELTIDSICFFAEDLGATTFTGSSKLIVSGNNNTITGFQFIGGNIEGDVIDVSGNHNMIQQVNVEAFDSHYYLIVRPDCQYNKIQYCNFESKPETQESSVVQVEVTENLPGYHVVSHCSFKNHTAPPGAGGDYGIEALRIGYSYQATFISRTLVEYCYFSKCNGDGEIISSKARENVYRYNTFENNGESHFTLRHGKDNVVYGNYFLGGAGIRIKEGQNQMVYNNYFKTGEHFAIRLMNHKADPLENIIIANNTFANSGSVLLGGYGDYKPKGVVLANNLFINPGNTLMEEPTGNEHIAGNLTNHQFNHLPEGVYHDEVTYDINSFSCIQITEIKNLHEYFRSDIPELLDIPVLNDDPAIELDIMKQKRSNEKRNFIGCFLPNKKIEMKPYVNENNTGPLYL